MQPRPFFLRGRAALRRLVAAGLFALTCLGAFRTAAQTTVLTSPSLVSLKNALNLGGTVVLNFDGTITASSPIVVSVDGTVVDATGHVVTIDGNNTTRIFDVATNVHFTVINLIIAGGNSIGINGGAGATGGNSSPKGGQGGNGTGGGNGLGGGIYNQGITFLENCVLTNDVATGGNGGAGGNGGNGANNGFGTGGNGGNGGNGGVGCGGAVYNLGTIILSNCAVTANTAIGGIGGIGGTNGTGTFASYSGGGGAGGPGSGAGLYNLGTATIINSTFNQNSASGETGPGGGGAPQSNGNGQPGPSGANSLGGGVCNLGTLSVINSTFFQNTVTGGAGETGGTGTQIAGNGGAGGNAYGGGLYSQGTVGITNCTFANGTVNGGAGGAAGSGAFVGSGGSTGVGFGANIAAAGGTFNFRNSILAYPDTSFNAYGTITDQGNNISSDSTFTFTTTNSFNNLDPLLGNLDQNGGQTETMELLPGSPAIDAIYDNSAPAFDQRGFGRPFGPRSDIGAFEYGSTTTNFSISGTVLIGSTAFPGVTVNVGGTSVNTDTNGNYSVFLAAGAGYAVAPQPLGYFSPSSASITLIANMTHVNFVATNSPTTAALNATNHNSFVLGFSTVPTFTYRIQAATNLVSTNGSSTNWVNIATNTATSNVILFTNVISTNFPKRFFRAVTP